jgi:acetolactate synthase-1/2/3 large subunit
MKGRDAIARILKTQGVEFIGLIPYNTLEEAVALESIRPLIFRQERVGVNLIDGYARVSSGRRHGVFTMQAGPGAENAFAGVAQAYADSTPILLLPASADRNRLGVHPTFTPSNSYSSVTKWSRQINLPERIPELMRQAFHQLVNGRPGPVLLEIPSDLLDEEVDDKLVSEFTGISRYLSSADVQDVRKVAKTLWSASCPIIHAGTGIHYAEAWNELLELSELLNAPVMTTLGGKSAFPENHPLSLGSGGNTTTGMVRHFLKKSDVILGAGCSFTKTSFGLDIPQGKILIHCTNDVNDVGKDYTVDQALIGDAKLVLRQIIDELKLYGPSNQSSVVVSEIRDVKKRWMKRWLPLLNSEDIPINPYRFINELMKTLDRNKSIVIPDAGSSRDHMTPFYESLIPRGFIGWGKSTQLGYSMGLAMGSKLAKPDRLAVAVMGDYAFGMVGMDFETAVRERIPILTIVLNNSRMGIYPDDRFPTANRIYGTKFLSGDYSKVAEALGGYNEKIINPNDIGPAIKRAERVIANGQPALLEIITQECHEVSGKE